MIIQVRGTEMDKDCIYELSLIIEKSMLDIEKYYEPDLIEASEENVVSKSLRKLVKELEDTKNTINYYLSSANEGYLVLENISSNYVIRFLNDGSFQPLSSGSYLEIYVNGKGWTVVKIEHSPEKGYYFYNPEIGYPKLYPNMKVRVKYRY